MKFQSLMACSIILYVKLQYTFQSLIKILILLFPVNVNTFNWSLPDIDRL